MEEFKTPGQFIEALLEQRGWTQRTLAIVLERDESTVNKMIAGTSAVTVETALALEDVFGEPAEQFLALQRSFDLAKARLIARPDPGRATRAHLFGGLPIADMIRRGWLKASDQRNVPEVEVALAAFFGVASVEEIPILPHAAKKTDIAGDPTPAQLAWLYQSPRDCVGYACVAIFARRLGRGHQEAAHIDECGRRNSEGASHIVRGRRAAGDR